MNESNSKIYSRRSYDFDSFYNHDFPNPEFSQHISDSIKSVGQLATVAMQSIFVSKKEEPIDYSEC